MFVIVNKICPLDSINEALHYFMTISHEMPVGLKKIQKKLLQEIEERIACKVHLYETRTLLKSLNTYCIPREAEQLTHLT